MAIPGDQKSFVPIRKLSKKEKRALAAKQRKTWGGINPVTRKPDNPKAYKRSKARQIKEDDPFHAEPYFLF